MCPLPYVGWGGGKCPRGRAAAVGEVLCYFRCSEGVSFNTWSHTCSSRNFPKFLFKEGSLTLMYMAALMFLAKPCDSLSTMEKHSGLTGCPVADVCRCMGEGALRCSLYLSPSVLPDSPMYCSVQFILAHLYLSVTPLLDSLESLSLGAMSNCLTVFVPLKCTCMPCLLHILLNFSPNPWMHGITMEMFFVLPAVVFVPVVAVGLTSISLLMLLWLF